ALVHQRALRCVGRAMRDHNRIYRAVPTALWQQFHKLYAAAEAFAIADAPVSDLINHDAPNPSCTSTYVHALLAQQATPTDLPLAQMSSIALWLRPWPPLVKLAPTVDAGKPLPPLATVLGSGTGARNASELRPTANVRYLDLDPISA